MKLRNKKTGEIKDIEYVILSHLQKNGSTLAAINIEEIKAEWEDHDGLKRYWYVGIDGEIYSKEYGYFNEEQDNIGNRFKTKEEAERAVNKLRAWKRLRDKGFKFVEFEEKDRGYIGDLAIYAHIEPNYTTEYPELDEDLDLLFGGGILRYE